METLLELLTDEPGREENESLLLLLQTWAAKHRKHCGHDHPFARPCETLNALDGCGRLHKSHLNLKFRYIIIQTDTLYSLSRLQLKAINPWIHHVLSVRGLATFVREVCHELHHPMGSQLAQVSMLRWAPCGSQVCSIGSSLLEQSTQ